MYPTVSFIVWLSTLVGSVLPQPAQKRGFARSNGPVTSPPTSLVGRFITPFHLVPTVLVPLTYVLGYPIFSRQPAILAAYNLPSVYYKDTLRLGASFAFIATAYAQSVVFDILAGNLHFIGVRENPTLVSTGPYAIVRHPLYSLVVLMHLCLGIAFWSKIPLYAAGICMAAFIVKIPIEEDLILTQSKIRVEYRAYMKNVRSRLIPGVW